MPRQMLSLRARPFLSFCSLSRCYLPREFAFWFAEAFIKGNTRKEKGTSEIRGKGREKGVDESNKSDEKEDLLFSPEKVERTVEKVGWGVKYAERP